jgi:hypothetical protein
MLQTMLRSPTLTILVMFEAVLTLLLWVGIATALVRCVRNSDGSRLWTLYLTCAAVLLLILAAGGEADVRFRAPVLPLLAIVAAIGYFPNHHADPHARRAS